MSPFTVIQDQLIKNQIKFDLTENSILVGAVDKNGFAVLLHSTLADPNIYNLSYDGWHYSFDNPEEAVSAFMFGLTNKCRLKVEDRGKKAYKWDLEYLNNSEWVKDSSVGVLFFPFLTKPTVKILQNNYVEN